MTYKYRDIQTIKNIILLKERNKWVEVNMADLARRYEVAYGVIRYWRNKIRNPERIAMNNRLIRELRKAGPGPEELLEQTTKRMVRIGFNPRFVRGICIKFYEEVNSGAPYKDMMKRHKIQTMNLAAEVYKTGKLLQEHDSRN